MDFGYFFPTSSTPFETSVSFLETYCKSDFKAPLGFLGEERTYLYKVSSSTPEIIPYRSSFANRSAETSGIESVSVLIFTNINEAVLASELKRLTTSIKKLERLKFDPTIFELGLIDKQEHPKKKKGKTKKLKEEEIFVRENGWLKRILIRDIEWIKLEGVYTHLFSNGKLHTLRSTTKDVFIKLPKSIFIQIHRSYYVNIFKIEAVKRYALKTGNDVLPIGKSYFNKLLDQLPHLGS